MPALIRLKAGKVTVTGIRSHRMIRSSLVINSERPPPVLALVVTNPPPTSFASQKRTTSSRGSTLRVPTIPSALVVASLTSQQTLFPSTFHRRVTGWS
jgi:hypothetical protein